MSEVHVFGVVPASAAPEVGEGGVRLIAHREVAALVTDVERTDLRAVSVLRAHWRVLEQAAASTTVLPVRFGTVMADEQAVVDDFLEPSHDELAATLAEFAGKVQLTVKGSYEEEALMASVVARSPAIARLREQVRGVAEAAAYYKRIELGQLVAAEVERARERDGREILARLEPLALAARVEPPSTAESAVNAAFLVDERRIDEFSHAVSALGRELAGRIRLRYVGPLPPYSFTGESANAGAGAWA
jgi:Gas vesicle synthesis protein GvpL/GvpF